MFLNSTLHYIPKVVKCKITWLVQGVSTRSRRYLLKLEYVYVCVSVCLPSVFIILLYLGFGKSNYLRHSRFMSLLFCTQHKSLNSSNTEIDWFFLTLLLTKIEWNINLFFLFHLFGFIHPFSNSFQFLLRNHSSPLNPRGFFFHFLILFYFVLNFILFTFTILYWFCHISKWICHRYTCVPHPEPSSLPVPSLWVIPVHQPQASSIVHRPWTGDSFHI